MRYGTIRWALLFQLWRTAYHSSSQARKDNAAFEIRSYWIAFQHLPNHPNHRNDLLSPCHLHHHPKSSLHHRHVYWIKEPTHSLLALAIKPGIPGDLKESKNREKRDYKQVPVMSEEPKSSHREADPKAGSQEYLNDAPIARASCQKKRYKGEESN